MSRLRFLVPLLLLASVSCRTGDESPRSGDEGIASRVPAPTAAGRIIVNGEALPIAAPVITWRDEGGFDAHRERCWFDQERVLPSNPASGCNTRQRFSSRGTKGLAATTIARLKRDGWDQAALEERLQHFVLHYDVCVTSTRCFQVLHDERGLSVHFLLDVDGTIYQTLDLVHRARHAGWTNDTSVGIEIAHIGAYPPEKTEWRQFYREDAEGLRVEPPPRFAGPPGIHRPARPGVFRERINGSDLEMVDYTEAQYRSLEALVDGLSRYFPRIRKATLRDAKGEVRADEVSRAELERFEGVIGHHHVTKRKTDPGPAMDWERILAPRDSGTPPVRP